MTEEMPTIFAAMHKDPEMMEGIIFALVKRLGGQIRLTFDEIDAAGAAGKAEHWARIASGRNAIDLAVTKEGEQPGGMA